MVRGAQDVHHIAYYRAMLWLCLYNLSLLSCLILITLIVETVIESLVMSLYIAWHAACWAYTIPIHDLLIPGKFHDTKTCGRYIRTAVCERSGISAIQRPPLMTGRRSKPSRIHIAGRWTAVTRSSPAKIGHISVGHSGALLVLQSFYFSQSIAGRTTNDVKIDARYSRRR